MNRYTGHKKHFGCSMTGTTNSIVRRYSEVSLQGICPWGRVGVVESGCRRLWLFVMRLCYFIFCTSKFFYLYRYRDLNNNCLAGSCISNNIYSYQVMVLPNWKQYLSDKSIIFPWEVLSFRDGQILFMNLRIVFNSQTCKISNIKSVYNGDT